MGPAALLPYNGGVPWPSHSLDQCSEILPLFKRLGHQERWRLHLKSPPSADLPLAGISQATFKLFLLFSPFTVNAKDTYNKLRNWWENPNTNSQIHISVLFLYFLPCRYLGSDSKTWSSWRTATSCSPATTDSRYVASVGRFGMRTNGSCHPFGL